MRFQKGMASELHSEIARKSIWALDDDDSHAVARDALQHRFEAGALRDGISATHCRVIDGLAFQLVSVRLGESLDGCSLMRRSRSPSGASISVHRAGVFPIRLYVKLTLRKRTQLLEVETVNPVKLTRRGTFGPLNAHAQQHGNFLRGRYGSRILASVHGCYSGFLDFLDQTHSAPSA
jgi:hypothetical protein